MSSQKIPFGKNSSGKLVGLDHVEAGLACACVCPECGSALVAKKGIKVVHHFAHHAQSDCQASFESVLHLAAKQVLAEARRLKIPGFTAEVALEEDEISVYECHTVEPRIVVLDEVRIEAPVGTRVIDVYASAVGKPLAIEVAVTHFCDYVKCQEFEALGVAALELDLSSLRMPLTLLELEAAVLHQIDNKRWLNNPRMRAVEDHLEAKLMLLLDEQLKVQRARLAQQALEAKRLAAAYESNKKAWLERYRKSPPEAKLRSALEKLSIFEKDIPACLRFKVPHDDCFGSAPEVWQLSFFVAFIYYDSLSGKKIRMGFNLDSAVAWVLERFAIAVDKVASIRFVMARFLENLIDAGYLEKHRRVRDVFVVKKHKL